MYYDWCRTRSRTAVAVVGAKAEHVEVEAKPAQAEPAQSKPSGQQYIRQQLRALQESYKVIIKVIDQLQGGCIYCRLMMKREQLHAYSKCGAAQADQCGYAAYQQWREEVDFGQARHCWSYRLSQSICQRLEQLGQQLEYKYSEVMLPSMFILYQRQHLVKVAEAVGFQGKNSDLYEWLNKTAEGFGWEWQSNWMETWMLICQMYIKLAQAEGEAWACK